MDRWVLGGKKFNYRDCGNQRRNTKSRGSIYRLKYYRRYLSDQFNIIGNIIPNLLDILPGTAFNETLLADIIPRTLHVKAKRTFGIV